MRFINRSVLGTLTAVVAMSVLGATITSASASAETCKKKAGSKFYVLCTKAGPEWAATKVGSPTEAKEVNFTLGLKAGTRSHLYLYGRSESEAAITITCSSLYGEGRIGSGGGQSASIKTLSSRFSGCGVKEAKTEAENERCKISNELNFLEVKGAFGPVGEVALEPVRGHVWMEFTVSGTSCPRTGTKLLEGAQAFHLGEPEVSHVSKAFSSEAKESKLEFESVRSAGLSMETSMQLGHGEYEGKELAVWED